MLKRILDILICCVVIVIAAPIVLIVVVLIYLALGKPILFRQIRIGFHGREFCIYKFKTMTDKRNRDGKLLPDEDRLTRLGLFLRSFSIDELPQIINVLKGDMSIVGPRPFISEYLPYYTEHQMQRHLVKPGITGWAQINGRNSISWEKKIELDLWYVENMSLSLDIKILLVTLYKVIGVRGVLATGNKDNVLPQEPLDIEALN